MAGFQKLSNESDRRPEAAWKRKRICFEFNVEIRSGERSDKVSIPEIQSLPKRIESPEPGSQHREFLSQLVDLLMFFQRVEADLRGGVADLSQEASKV